MKKLLLTALVLFSLGGGLFAQEKKPAKVTPKKSAEQKAKAHNDRIITLKKAKQTAELSTGEATKPVTATANKKD